MSDAFDINDLKRRMEGAINSLKHDLNGLRTGRASASLLEPIVIEAYGSTMPINQVANITVPESRMLSVSVWDKSMVGLWSAQFAIPVLVSILSLMARRCAFHCRN